MACPLGGKYQTALLLLIRKTCKLWMNESKVDNVVVVHVEVVVVAATSVRDVSVDGRYKLG